MTNKYTTKVWMVCFMRFNKLAASVVLVPVLIAGTATASYASTSTENLNAQNDSSVSDAATQSSHEEILDQVEMYVGPEGQSFEFVATGEASLQLEGETASVIGPDGERAGVLPQSITLEDGSVLPLDYSKNEDGVVTASFSEATPTANHADGGSMSVLSAGNRSAACYVSAAGTLVTTVGAIGSVFTGPVGGTIALAGYGLSATSTLMSCS